MAITIPARGRSLAIGQRSELTIIALDGNTHVLWSHNQVIEAPNWTPDGKHLVFNAGGLLFRIAITGGDPEPINTGHLADLNNDHVLSPDGSTIYASSDDGHLYAITAAGGMPRRVSNTHDTPFHYYLHSISPDGLTLSYVAIEQRNGTRQVNVFTIPAAGGPDTRLTDLAVPNDGPEYSPDGQWIYFNSELAATQPGHAQVFRIRASDGSELQQLTFDTQVNWFPHPSPDGKVVSVLSYPPGTVGHPPDKPVQLRLMGPDGSNLRTLVSLFGGQGTINVNSWSPDSKQLAFVAYPQG